MVYLIQLQMYGDVGLLILRLAVGVIFLVHGLQKWKMWKAEPSAQMSTSTLSVMRLLSIAEPLGAIAVASGFLTQIAALCLSLVMLGAMFMKTTKWGSKFTGNNGWELDFIIFSACIAILLLGSGMYAVEAML